MVTTSFGIALGRFRESECHEDGGSRRPALSKRIEKSALDFEFGALAHEGDGILEGHLIYPVGSVATLFHFESGVRDRQGTADAPVAGAVHPDAFGAKPFEHVNRPAGAAFGFGIQGHARPEALVKDHAYGVFFNMIDDATFRFDAGIIFQSIHDQAGALVLIFKMWSVNKNQLVAFRSNLDVLFQNDEFIPTIFVETDFSDTENVGLVDEFGDQCQHVVCKLDVFRFLRIYAKPGKMWQTELGGTLGFVLGELTEVIVKSIGRASVKARPKSRFADGLASGSDHGQVIVGGAADHVAMWFDVSHVKNPCLLLFLFMHSLLRAMRHRRLWWWQLGWVRWWDH